SRCSSRAISRSDRQVSSPGRGPTRASAIASSVSPSVRRTPRKVKSWCVWRRCSSNTAGVTATRQIEQTSRASGGAADMHRPTKQATKACRGKSGYCRPNGGCLSQGPGESGRRPARLPEQVLQDWVDRQKVGGLQVLDLPGGQPVVAGAAVDAVEGLWSQPL